MHEELTNEINEVNEPFPALSSSPPSPGAQEGGRTGLSVEAIAAASQKATRKLEKSIENVKKKVLPETVKTLEGSFDQKLKTQIAAKTAKIEKKLKGIST